MQVREAKDFLVQQVVQQAQLENVEISNLEKRMMYFTEEEDASEDPCALEEEFEEKYDDDEYISKISGLLSRAHRRIKRDNSHDAYLWNEAVNFLRKGDHFILVLLGPRHYNEKAIKNTKPRPPYDLLKLLGTGILVTVTLVSFFFIFQKFAGPYGFTWSKYDPPRTVKPVPIWAQRTMLAIYIGTYVSFFFLPKIHRYWVDWKKNKSAI